MPKVVKHAWTHRPRSQGGTDPIEIPGGAKWAYAEYANQTHSISSGLVRIRLHRLYTNDPALFTLEDQSEDTIRAGTNSWADYLGIAEDGVYEVRMQATITTRNVFDGFDTDLDPIYDNGAGDADFNAGTFVLTSNRLTPHNEMRATPEWDHNNLWHDAVCMFDSDLEGITLPWKIAARIETAMTGSVGVGLRVWVKRVEEGLGGISHTFIG